MKRLLPLDRMARLSGFGMTASADAYLYRPETLEDVIDAIDLARSSGRQIVLRGAGQSYGDANIGAECIALDLSAMARILSWDPQSGVIEVEGGVTVEDLWRRTLPDGYWPPVVSGTMRPTLGGALAMNIHGKNNFHAGPIGEHVLEIVLVDGRGQVRTLQPEDELFRAVIGGIGLLGVVVRAKLRMKKLPSASLRVLPVSCPNLEAQFKAFEQHEHDSDYRVSWVDCFARGSNLGRGLFHAASYEEKGDPALFDPSKQDLPTKILGVFPKSLVWRFLKPINNRPCMRMLNWAKHASARRIGNGKEHRQGLVAFSFLLDYVPNWRRAYEPGGLIQYQSFVPREHAREVFAKQIGLQQEAGLESFLGVMKRHQPDRFLLSHAVDGYSLALDFKVTDANRARLFDLAHKMNDLVLSSEGRFYFAKDSTLRPADVRAYLGDETLAKFAEFRKSLDPDGLFTSELARRLELP